MMERVYLDHNATTPLRPEALRAMEPYLTHHFGNPSSVHWAGREAKRGVEEAREQVAALIGAQPEEIVFTSGGTESNNLAVQGMALGFRSRGRHIVTTAIEHSSVLECVKRLEGDGCAATFLPVDREGMVSPEMLSSALRDDTIFVSVALANPEVGTIQPLEQVSRIAHARGIPVHADGVQAAGKIPVDVKALEVDLLSLSSHKISGPKGVGALYIRKGIRLAPLLHGGPQERNRRPGTENVAGIAGFGAAAALAAREQEVTAARCLGLTTRLWKGILERVDDAILNGPRRGRLPNTLNVSFAGVDGESLLIALDLEGIAVSSGSACSAGSVEPSHVLVAMGRTAAEAQTAVRFSLGRNTTEEEIDLVLEVLPRVIERIRAARAA